MELSILQCIKVIKAAIVLYNRAILSNVPMPQRRRRNNNDDDDESDASDVEYEDDGEDQNDDNVDGDDDGTLDEITADDPEGLLLRRRLIERFFQQ